MSALAKLPLSTLDINDRVRQLINDPMLRVIEQFDLFDSATSVKYSRDARQNVARLTRTGRRKVGKTFVLKEQLALLLRDHAERPKRRYRRARKDTFGTDRPTWSRGEACAFPVWSMFESLLKLSRLGPDTAAAEEIWDWVEERDPPMVKRFDARGREVLVPYPFAFENACMIGGIDPESLRRRLLKYRGKEFPSADIRNAMSLWRSHLDDIADHAEEQFSQRVRPLGRAPYRPTGQEASTWK